MPYAMATARTIARHEMGGFLSVIRLRVRASPREPLSYEMGGVGRKFSRRGNGICCSPCPTFISVGASVQEPVVLLLRISRSHLHLDKPSLDSHAPRHIPRDQQEPS